jgi:putative oxidoreductase
MQWMTDHRTSGPRGALVRAEPWTWLLLRLFVGAFLVWGVWDNVISSERMAEFARFLSSHNFPAPALMAPLSVYAQLACGLAIALGGFTRIAGLVCAFNFAVAVAMVDAKAGVRGAFPATMLILVGLQLATRGAGPLALDRFVSARLLGDKRA